MFSGGRSDSETAMPRIRSKDSLETGGPNASSVSTSLLGDGANARRPRDSSNSWRQTASSPGAKGTLSVCRVSPSVRRPAKGYEFPAAGPISS